MLFNRARTERRHTSARTAVVVGASLLLAATCSEAPPSASSVGEPSTTNPDAGGSSDRSGRDPAGELPALPVREGPREETTYAVPHVQVYADPVPEVDAELRRRAFLLPGVEDRESTLSVAGTRSLWLADDVEIARPEVVEPGREFAHIHPNGSLHVRLPVDRAIEVTETKWGELHPWVGSDDVWDGLVMVYTPETLDELDVTIQIIVDAYNFVTGADIDPTTVD